MTLRRLQVPFVQWSDDAADQCERPPSDTVARKVSVLAAMTAPPFTQWADRPACTDACKCLDTPTTPCKCPFECYEGLAFDVLEEVRVEVSKGGTPFEYEIEHVAATSYNNSACARRSLARTLPPAPLN